MIGRLKVQKSEGINEGSRPSKVKVEKYMLNRENNPQPMNRGKELTVETKLWIVFKQGEHDIEFVLSVPACTGNKAICGLGWCRVGNRRLQRIDKVDLCTEKEEKAAQQRVKRWVNVTKFQMSWEGKRFQYCQSSWLCNFPQ